MSQRSQLTEVNSPIGLDGMRHTLLSLGDSAIGIQQNKTFKFYMMRINSFNFPFKTSLILELKLLDFKVSQYKVQVSVRLTQIRPKMSLAWKLG